MKLAVLSNKPHEATYLAVTGLFGSDTFEVIQGLEVGMKKKPDPSGAWKIAKKLQVEPSECMYVGDTNTDMKTGKAAGMYTIGVLWGFRERKELEENHADEIIDRPEKLLKIEECMAVVVKNIKEVKEYLDESGMDVEGMSKEELLEASEIFSLPDGTYLIVEG